MDPGLATTEHSYQRRGLSVSTDPIDFAPTITCRQCRAQFSLDDMDSHECKPPSKTVTSSPRAVAALNAAAKATTNFLDKFLDDVPALPTKPTSSPRTSYDTQSVRTVEVVQPVYIAPTTQYQQFSSIPSPPQMESVPTPDFTSNWNAPLHSPSFNSTTYVHPAPIQTTTQPLQGLRASTPTAATVPQSRSPAQESSAPIQCRVRGVRLNKDKVALYSIVSNILKGPDGHPLPGTSPAALTRSNSMPVSNNRPVNEVIVERRYREFYAFAQSIYAMYPSTELWNRLPPKTMCMGGYYKTDGFLLRRKNGLDDFIRCALQTMDLGSSAQGSIGQWYLVRKFLNLPPTLAPQLTHDASVVSKDRSLVAATNELKKHARQTMGWTPVGRVDEHDTTYEKTSDGFQMIKRVKTCFFPARAVFDMIIKRSTGEAWATNNSSTPNSSPPVNTVVDETNGEILEQSPSQPLSTVSNWDPLVETVEILKRESRQTWTERTVFKGRWISRNMEMISIKSWKVEDTGSIVIVMIPADDGEWRESKSNNNRVDCVLGGWIITPIPGEDTCTVTWIMQANFGECDPQNEFTSFQGLSAYVARSFLLSWAEEVVYLLDALSSVYDPQYYRNLGPLLSGGEFKKVKLHRNDSTSLNLYQDPRIYVLANELEPHMCLLIHKNLNTNVLIFKPNHRTPHELELKEPLKAEWIMFEKPDNPRQDLSTLERTTTYGYTSKNIGPNVFQFTLDLLKPRECILRNDPIHGYGVFLTMNGKPNQLLERIYLNYGKSSRLSFSKVEEMILFSDKEMEIISYK